MRIMHVTKKYPPALGGDAIVVDALRREQGASGHQTTVVTSRCAGVGGPGVVPFGLSDTAQALDTIGPRRLMSIAALVARAGRILDLYKPDVVHTHTPDLGLVVALAAHRRGIPTVNTCHDVEADRAEGPLWKRTMELLLLRKARHYAIVTHYSGPLRLLGVGRLERQKGFDVLLTAFAELERDRPGAAVLRIAGEGSQRTALEGLASGSGGHVEFLGVIDHEDMPTVYAASDVYVLPSRFETGPITFFEAWAAGVATVASRVGLLPEVATDGRDALLVPPDDARSLAAALRCLIDDPQRVALIGRCGLEKIKTLPTWADVAKQYEDVYAEAAAR
jgi:glycosyltransferase involved in cell wall biosynthesis